MRPRPQHLRPRRGPVRVLARFALLLPLVLAGSLLQAATSPVQAAVAARNLPAGGRVLPFVGQSTPDLSAYRSQVLGADSSFPRPGGVTLYTNITPGVCNGLTGHCNLRGNVVDFPRTLAEYPGAALAVGLYLSDAPGCSNQPLRALIGRGDADIAGGLGQQYRNNLDTLIRFLKDTGRAVYLRVGYEFDGPWNCYNRDFYTQAFRYAKGRIDALGAANVATVWQSATYQKDGNAQFDQDFSNPRHFETWYPGNDVVDWVGISTFSWERTWKQYQWACDTPSVSSPRLLYDRALTFSRARSKPVLIAESAPQAYRTRQLDASCTTVNDRRPITGVQQLGAWYDEWFGYVDANRDVIRGSAYINADWEAIEQFACPPGARAGQTNCTDGYWGNSRVQDDPTIRNGFKRELQNQIYVNGTLAGRGVDWGSGAPPTTPPTTTPPTTAPPTTAPPTTAPPTGPSGPAPGVPPADGRWLLAGQSTRAAYDDLTAATGTAPNGGSVYYEVRSGTWVSPVHRDYADLLGRAGKVVQLGISWKDNPPGWNGGDENAKAARVRQVTRELGDGAYADRFTTLVHTINRYPSSRFLLRLDYEVSRFYHCTDDSCSSYKDAFRRIRQSIDSRVRQRNVDYVYHPVRGEFEQLYPGDAAADWVGVSVFAHELCLPIHDRGYLYNGTPPQNYDVGRLQCRNAYVGRDANGNDAAVWANWDHDGNVLKMMKFARDRGKPMIVSEGGMMNFTADGSDASGLEPVRGDTWVKRLFGLLAYRGPIPNRSGTHDLSGVIRAVTYIDLDLRYGWDGVDDGSFDFPRGSTWYVDGRLTRYQAARASFCAGLAARGFGTRCR